MAEKRFTIWKDEVLWENPEYGLTYGVYDTHTEDKFSTSKRITSMAEAKDEAKRLNDLFEGKTKVEFEDDYRKAVHMRIEGSWNAVCLNGSAHIRKTTDIINVTCKKCYDKLFK